MRTVIPWYDWFTLSVIVFQTYLLLRQTKLANTQLELLGRRSNLDFAFEESGGTSYTPRLAGRQENEGRFALEFCSHNKGTRRSRDYYFTILIPRAWNDDADAGLQQRETLPHHGITEVEGTRFHVYQTMVTKPLYPGRWATFAVRSFSAPYGEHVCLWYFSDEDGEYPKHGEYGRVTVDVRR